MADEPASRSEEQVWGRVRKWPWQRIGLIALVLLLFVLLVGRCAGGDDGSSAPTTTVAPATSTVVPGSTTTVPATTTIPGVVWSENEYSLNRPTTKIWRWVVPLLVVPLLVIVVMYLSSGAGGAWAKLGLVLIGSIMLWLVVAPLLRPTLTTPSGKYQLSLGDDDAVRATSAVAAIDTKCGQGGAVTGRLVNLGSAAYNVLLEIHVGTEVVYQPVLGLAAGSVQEWSVTAPAPVDDTCLALYAQVRPIITDPTVESTTTTVPAPTIVVIQQTDPTTTSAPDPATTSTL